MAKFLVGLVAGMILAVLIAVILVFAAVRLSERPPEVADNSVLVLRLEGELVEKAPVTIPLPFFEARRPLTVADFWDLIRKAEADSRIRAVVVMPAGLAAGWGKLEELRTLLARLRNTGKPVVAFLREPSTREYYVAAAAGRIYMPPEDMLDMKGLRAEVMFLRRTLDKLGVQVEIEHAGKYKDFGDRFTRTAMSPETREVLNSILDDLYGRLVAAVGAARRKSPAEVRALLDEGPFLARQALAKGLMDGLLYEDQVFAETEKLAGGKPLRKLSARDYLRVPASSLKLSGPRIALVAAEGTIVSGRVPGFGDEDVIESGPFSQLLRRVAEDRSIRGVIVRIDSPGGSAFASDEIWRQMNALSKKKPVVISMSDTAASGGYYIAMTGDPIVAYPGTFTGSIGVVYGKVNLRGLYDKIGVNKELLTRGRFADLDSDYTPLNDAARKKLREGLEATYRAFVERVAQARKRRYEEIEPLAQGRVWLGSQARERGLVDELGGLDRAIELVRKKAGIRPEEKISLVVYPPKRTILERLMQPERETAWGARLRAIWREARAAAWLEGGMLRLMPFAVEVR
jgi:protease-4